MIIIPNFVIFVSFVVNTVLFPSVARSHAAVLHRTSYCGLSAC